MTLPAAWGAAVAFVGTLGLSAWAIRVGQRFPAVSGRAAIPALGGIAMILAWWGAAALTGGVGENWRPLAVATVAIVLVGFSDIRRPLGPWTQLLLQLLIACAAVIGEIAVRYVTHPFGGLLRLDAVEMLGVPLLGALLTLVWMVVLMNAVNFLDGLDGLAGSISVAAFVAVGAVSLLPHVREPDTARLAWLAAAALGGFLFWNLPPARLYLGTPGAWFIGFLLAVFSVQGSSKIATLAVVGAMPLLDAISVVLGRLRRGRSPVRGDTTHLHHRLLQRGWSPQRILAAYVIVSVLLGLGAVFLPTSVKIVLVAVLGSGILSFAVFRPSRRPDARVY
jgi:UDP-GlcNAc:undecaprenyl-phosphate/decaprenyl-phosphate GlcNAc-1-phosphate transferase